MIYLSTIAVCAILYMDITWTCGLITSTELWQVTFTHSSTTQGSRLLKLKYTLKLSGEIGKQDTQIIYVSTTRQGNRKAGHPNQLCFYHPLGQQESRTRNLFMFYHPLGQQESRTPKLVMFLSPIRAIGQVKLSCPGKVCTYCLFFPQYFFWNEKYKNGKNSSVSNNG